MGAYKAAKLAEYRSYLEFLRPENAS